MKQKFIFFTTFIALLVAPFFYILKPKDLKAKFGEMKAIEVLATYAKKEKIKINKIFPARVKSSKIAEVRPQISGIILKRLFKEGSFVVKGQQLYEIDADPFIANLKNAYANLKMSQAALKPIEAKYNRYKELVKVNAISQQQFEEVASDYELKKADILAKEALLKKYEIEYDYTKVYAPISGKISKSYVTEGALVEQNQSQVLAIITQLDPIYIDIAVPTQDYFEIRKKINDEIAKVEITISGQKNPYPILGELKFSESIVNETTSSVSMRAVIRNRNLDLLPGLFVNAKLILGDEEVILVPQRTTKIKENGNLELWVIDEKNIVAKRNIKAKNSYKDFWIVDKGIKEGERIVLEGIQKINEGSKVEATFEDNEEKTDDELKKPDENKNESDYDKENILEKKDVINKKNQAEQKNVEPKIIEQKEIISYDEFKKINDYHDKINNFIEEKISNIKKEVLKDEEKLDAKIEESYKNSVQKNPES